MKAGAIDLERLRVALRRMSRAILGAQKISADGPGTILRDLEAMLAFIGEHGVPTKSKQGNLPAEALPALNARLAHPIEVELKRPLLQHYPNLAGLYILLRVMNLVRMDRQRIWLQPDALAVWHGFNPIERYFALLEAWLFRAGASVLGAGTPPLCDQYDENLSSLARLTTSKWKTFSEDCHFSRHSGAASAWNTHLQMMFGLIVTKPRSRFDRKGEGRGWIMAKARRTPWGTAVLWAVFERALAALPEDERGEDYLVYRTLERAGFGFLQPVLRPYFPAWEKIFPLPAKTFRAGTYIFKVALAGFRAQPDTWRRLAVPGTAMLDELADAILAAFAFDDTGHLYRFRYRDRLGIETTCYNSAEVDGMGDDDPCAWEIVVGATDLPDHGAMEFTFDFGAAWDFALRFERLDAPSLGAAAIRTIESAGVAPSQYSG